MLLTNQNCLLQAIFGETIECLAINHHGEVVHDPDLSHYDMRNAFIQIDEILETNRSRYFIVTGTSIESVAAYRSGGTKVCPHRPIRLDRLDAVVWADLCQLLQNPKTLQDEFERRLASDTEAHFDLDQIHKQIKSVQRGISRLIDAYQVGLLEKVDFEPRMARARERLSRLQLEAKSAQDRDAQRKEVRLVLGQLEDFAEQVRIGLDQANFSKRREVSVAW